MSIASALGIQSVPAAIVFAILYVPLLAFFLSKTIRRPVYVYIILTLFCVFRVTAFVLRALLADVPADANSLSLIITYEVFYNIGFFGLLYSAYSLVTDRVDLAPNPPSGPITRLLRRRFLFRIALAAAVAIGITGTIDSVLGTTASTLNTGTTLRKVAVYIFLVCTALVVLQTFFLARVEFADGGYRGSTSQLGSTYGIYILFVICILLLAREIFFTATAGNPTLQDKEAIWYPLAAVTELIAVVLFATPGLVPNPSKE